MYGGSGYLNLQSQSIGFLVDAYVSGRLLVNRKYQRKLIWSLDEKKLLIDSIMNNIPLPLFYLREKLVDSERGNQKCYEIIDGLQRIDAIVSFVLQHYSINWEGREKFFSLDNISRIYAYKECRNENILTGDQNCLDPDYCFNTFYSFQISIAVIDQHDALVNTIFTRINSTGRSVSPQDFRQSFAVGNFANLVRRIAGCVRGDTVIDETVNMSKIKSLSVGPKKLGYGVDINNVFWMRHDIITRQNFKESKDEELLETIFALIVLGDFKKTKSNLDDLYKEGTELYTRVEAELRKRDEDKLVELGVRVFEVIDEILDSVNSDFTRYVILANSNTSHKVSNKDDVFIVLYLVIFELLQDGFDNINNTEIAESIRDCYDGFFIKIINDGLDYFKVSKIVKKVKAIIQPNFIRGVDNDFDFSKMFTALLRNYPIETQRLEFKIGISNFNSREVNNSIISGICKTAVAMANPRLKLKDSYIIIGIADNKKGYVNWCSAYNKSGKKRYDHWVVGINDEAQKLFGSLDSYLTSMKDRIKNEPMDEGLKEFLLSNMVIHNYYGKALFVIRVSSDGKDHTYAGHQYVRRGNSTEVV